MTARANVIVDENRQCADCGQQMPPHGGWTAVCAGQTKRTIPAGKYGEGVFGTGPDGRKLTCRRKVGTGGQDHQATRAPATTDGWAPPCNGGQKAVMNVIELKDIVKSYQMGDTVVHALNHVTVNFEKGQSSHPLWAFRQREIHHDEHPGLSGSAYFRRIHPGGKEYRQLYG